MGRLGERAGRLKPNGSLLGRPPLTDVVELEALSLGVAGKLRLWRTPKTLADALHEMRDVDFTALSDRAEDQLAGLDVLHRAAAASQGAPRQDRVGATVSRRRGR